MNELGANKSKVVGIAEPEVVVLVVPHSDASASRLESLEVRGSHVAPSKEILQELEEKISREACQTQLDTLPNQEERGEGLRAVQHASDLKVLHQTCRLSCQWIKVHYLLLIEAPQGQYNNTCQS